MKKYIYCKDKSERDTVLAKLEKDGYFFASGHKPTEYEINIHPLVPIAFCIDSERMKIIIEPETEWLFKPHVFSADEFIKGETTQVNVTLSKKDVSRILFDLVEDSLDRVTKAFDEANRSSDRANYLVMVDELSVAQKDISAAYKLAYARWRCGDDES